MVRLLVIVEGETEETFVGELLAPYLYERGFESVSPKIMGNARLRSRRGGIRGWPGVKTEIIRHLKQDRSIIVTTMVDYYALPQSSGKVRAWPGRATAPTLPFGERARHVQKALLDDVVSAVGTDKRTRFIPFVVMHEFEGLLFSDCAAFANGIGKPGLEPNLQAIRDGFASPEEINDSPATHPSKRIQDLLPGYQKPLYGSIAALNMGLTPIRNECPNFRAWLETLEQYGSSPTASVNDK